MEGICNIKSDLEKQSRLYTLRSTYKNGFASMPVTGGPTLVELIEKVSGGNATSDANDVVKRLKTMWKKEYQKNYQ